MPKATWNGAILARSSNTVMIEGNHYFPPDDVDRTFLRPSERTSTCPWKGTARYYDVVVDGKVNSAAAWEFADPKPKAAAIRGHIAFWGGVEIRE